MVTALDTTQARNVGLITIVAVIVIGLLLAVLISKLIVRALVILVMLVLALVAYQQRGQLETAAKRCDATFFGIHVTPHDPALKKHCQQLSHP
jgi:hypothetical protein